MVIAHANHKGLGVCSFVAFGVIVESEFGIVCLDLDIAFLPGSGSEKAG